MSVRSLAIPAFALALCLVARPADSRPGDADRWLTARLNALAADPRIAPARVGVAVQDVASGKTLARIRADEGFNVASCAKLVTSATALWSLGPEYRFKTVLYAAREPDKPGSGGRSLPGPVVEGDLYLKGFGSPTLDEADLWQLVDELVDRGIRAIRGRLVIDESFFDGERLAPLYDSKSTDSWYRPPNGPLSLGSNAVSVRVYGGDAPGKPARIVLRPRSSYLTLVDKVTTVVPKRRSWVQVETRARGARTEVEVRGRVRVGYRRRAFRRRIEDPGLFTGYALLDVLGRRGIKVAHKDVVRGKLPPKVRLLAAHYSEPLAVVLRRMNKRSNNFIAEQVLKTVGAEVEGAPGTWGKGLKVAARFLKTLSIQPSSYTMKNGSGLYDATSFSPTQLVKVLRASSLNFRAGADFVASLPQAGVDGTLGHRFVGSGAERYVRAKTGTLARVVTLSGYAGAATLRGPIAFSILINDLPDGKVGEARQVADDMARALVQYLER